jgi:hypothetical protein
MYAMQRQIQQQYGNVPKVAQKFTKDYFKAGYKWIDKNIRNARPLSSYGPSKLRGATLHYSDKRGYVVNLPHAR